MPMLTFNNHQQRLNQLPLMMSIDSELLRKQNF